MFQYFLLSDEEMAEWKGMDIHWIASPPYFTFSDRPNFRGEMIDFFSNEVRSGEIQPGVINFTDSGQAN